MRDINDQLQEIMKRKDIIAEDHERQKSVITNAVATGVCVVLIIVTALFIPRLKAAAESMGNVQYGSLIISAPYIGYVVIGVLAFALGVFVTLLCLKLRRKNLK